MVKQFNEHGSRNWELGLACQFRLRKMKLVVWPLGMEECPVGNVINI